MQAHAASSSALRRGGGFFSLPDATVGLVLGKSHQGFINFIYVFKFTYIMISVKWGHNWLIVKIYINTDTFMNFK